MDPGELTKPSVTVEEYDGTSNLSASVGVTVSRVD